MLGILFIIVIIIIIASAIAKSQAESKSMIKIIYTFLLGIFLAVFIGVGIAAFYPEPKTPDMPAVLKYGGGGAQDANQYSEYKAEAEKYNVIEKEYMMKMQTYNRNASIIAVICAIMIVVASLTLFKKILVIADGLLLGGVLTLLYSVIRGFDTDDNMFRFFVVSIGLIVSLVLGYIKFIRPTQNT